MKDLPRAPKGPKALLISPEVYEALADTARRELIHDTDHFIVRKQGHKTLIRLRGTPGETGSPPIPPFLLAKGETGARCYKGVLEWYVTTLTFEKKFIYDKEGNLLEDVNGLIKQDEITGVKTMELEGESSSGSASDPQADDWKQLDWWGDVYVAVELDGETGKPLSIKIQGPEKPDLSPIPELDEDLSRPSGSASGSSGAFGFSVKIGTVPENGPIEQERTGNIQWFLAFVPENDASSSSGSSSASSGASSAASSASAGSGAGSSKDTAIVPTSAGYRKWYAMESAEVLFFDFMEYEVPRGITHHLIDPLVMESIAPGTIRAFISAERGRANVTIQGDAIVIHARHWPWPATQRVQIMLRGIRRGFANVRMAPATEEDFIDNECRLNPRRTREEIITALSHATHTHLR
jgi:hypothetical protein